MYPGLPRILIGPVDGKMILHMRRIHILTCIRSYPVGLMSYYNRKLHSALLYFVNTVSADYSGTVLMHLLIHAFTVCLK